MKEKNVAKAAFKPSAKTEKSGIWVLFIWIFTFFIASVLTFVTSDLMKRTNIVIAAIILLLIIFLNIFFDIIGTAVTAADITPFNSMAARKVYGAKNAIQLIKNADKVANFCNDVIGDICGIVSGAASTYIIVKIAEIGGLSNVTYIEILMGGFVAALTVGGKSLGKRFAINSSNNVIYKVAVVIRFIKRR